MNEYFDSLDREVVVSRSLKLDKRAVNLIFDFVPLTIGGMCWELSIKFMSNEDVGTCKSLSTAVNSIFDSNFCNIVLFIELSLPISSYSLVSMSEFAFKSIAGRERVFLSAIDIWPLNRVK